MIFLVVFLELPALQRSQRDTARRQDVAKAVAALQQFYADGGDPRAIPANPKNTAENLFWADKFADIPVLGPYLSSAGISQNIQRAKIFAYPACSVSWTPGNWVMDEIEIYVGCKTEGRSSDGVRASDCQLVSADPQNVVLAVRLEAGSGGGRNYCVDAGR